MYWTLFAGDDRLLADLDDDRTRHTTLEDELSHFDFIDDHAATDCSDSDIHSDQELAPTFSNDMLDIPCSFSRPGKDNIYTTSVGNRNDIMKNDFYLSIDSYLIFFLV